jgi:hypothetical protein
MMEHDTEKVDEVALALLLLTLHDHNRAWKGMSWEVSDRLHKKGWIKNPKNKNESVELTPVGYEACVLSFLKHFVPSEASIPLSRLPVSRERLEHFYYRDEDDLHAFFIDSATGLLVSSTDDERALVSLPLDALLNNPRYLVLPICTAEERVSPDRFGKGAAKRVRQQIEAWLDSHPVLRL